ncbi:hypothetical protein [Ensifer sp. MJa1]|uniref:hypothetical protein n=1 Tax=Ensifer sp. MJa1 TaxID=2919888 RepID=UPI0030086920
MRETFLLIVRCLWWVTVVGAATTFGALYGWQGYGWDGALGYGLIGLGAGSTFAAFPGACLDLFLSLADIT